MCGRLNIISDPLTRLVSAQFATHFSVETNTDLCPSQYVASLVANNSGIYQLNAQWGIQPNWSNRLLINAQSESVMSKRTFSQAFAQHRCVVPCSGWYEWSTNSQTEIFREQEIGQQSLFDEPPSQKPKQVKKQKYLFTHAENEPLYMAGIYYPHFNPQQDLVNAELVTLTEEPDEICGAYHHRMPVLIEANQVEYYLKGSVSDVQTLFDVKERLPLAIRAV